MSKYFWIKEIKFCYVYIIFNEIFIGNYFVFFIILRVFISLSFYFLLEIYGIVYVL